MSMIEKAAREALERIGGELRVDGFNEVFCGVEDYGAMIVRDDEPGCALILAQQMQDQMAHDFITVFKFARAALNEGEGHER